MDSKRIILGIDPGTQILGYGVIETVGKDARYLAMGVLDMRKLSNHYIKLRHIFDEVTRLIEIYSPDDLAVEAPFYGKNVQSMLKLGRAQGSAIAAALNKDIPIFEYAPKRVKLAITGKGGASKEQVATLLTKILKVEEHSNFLDATDGLAVAYCHYLQLSNLQTDKIGSYSWESYIKTNPGRVK
ncbi:MAG: crossover junction endodeoxyribonuclease RuvC [Bacteroidales bacterium]